MLRVTHPLALSLLLSLGPAPVLAEGSPPAAAEVGALADPTEPVAATPERGLSITPSGQLLARFRHLEGRDFEPSGVSRTVSQRARVGLAFELERVSLVIQVQDVRIWGDATDTLGDFSADGFDLHQGYVEIRVAEALTLRVGRQTIDWLNQRLIGSVAWIEQARSLDAARLSYRSEDSRMTAELFYARTRHAIVDTDPRPEDVLAGLWQYRVNAAFVPAVLAIVDLNGPLERARVTAGLHATGLLPHGFSYSAEAYFQGGQATRDVSIAAFLTALRLRYTPPGAPLRPYFELRAEVVSGDEDPTDGTVRSFDTLFATNHAFYGEMDFFLNLPAQTGQRGLVDLGGKLGLAPDPRVDVSVAAHVFQTHQPRGGPRYFGTELDLRAEWRPFDALRLDFVYAVLLPGEAFTGGSPTAIPEHFIYSTLHTVF